MENFHHISTIEAIVLYLSSEWCKREAENYLIEKPKHFFSVLTVKTSTKAKDHAKEKLIRNKEDVVAFIDVVDKWMDKVKNEEYEDVPVRGDFCSNLINLYRHWKEGDYLQTVHRWENVIIFRESLKTEKNAQMYKWFLNIRNELMFNR